MIRLLPGTAAAALIIVFFAFWFAPGGALAATCGVASWYGTESGSKTANGEHFDGRSLTAASKTLPFGTVLLVRNMVNGLTVRVRINDRGPFIRGRILDLSRSAAVRLGMVGLGTTKVCMEKLR